MQKSTFAAAALAAALGLALGYFASLHSGKVVIAKHAHGAQDCRGKTCKIDINVDNCDPSHPDNDKCDVYAVQELTLVNKDNANLDFKIGTNGFDFDPSDGIKFDLYNGVQYFPCAPQGSQFRCVNQAPAGTAIFKYTIHVKGLDPVDPWVVNY